MKIPPASLLIACILKAGTAHAADCTTLAREADARGATYAPPLSYIVGDAGRLYFHSAPDPACRSKDVFVVPNDRLVGYAEYKGFISVMYLNPVTLKSYLGWVEARRLQYQGTLAPGKAPGE
ncbi:MAG TPA: hypothetical protein VGN52_25960 [Burkholderiales bacterium]|jgi:hypothetical protein